MQVLSPASLDGSPTGMSPVSGTVVEERLALENEPAIELKPGDIVEVVDISDQILERDRDDGCSEYFRGIAAQFLNTYGGVPMRVLAVNPPFMILKTVSTGQKILANTRLVSFRRAPADWVKHFLS